MPPNGDVAFGRFRLDAANECLWDGARAISLRPKAFAVLKLLVENSEQLVTKQHVLDLVWPGTFVSDAVLKDSIRQLRDALGDDAAKPTYIETAHRRGYRFIAKVLPVSRASKPPFGVADGAARPKSNSATPVHGREPELNKLMGWLALAFGGDRQTVLVTGEAGIGKTTLVQALLQRAATSPNALVARGQCLEQYGAGEAYMPVLDGLSRLGRSADGASIVELMRHHAPSWLAQMPSLVPAPERQTLQTQVLGVTRERMLREMAELLEILTAQTPLILVLEDLHWSDYSTLELISYLARRPDKSRLLVIGTYRPVEVILGEHPLKGIKRELQAHGLCHELPLGYLSEKAVAEYLHAKFPGAPLPARLARMIHRRTEGNPLFMVNVVDYLLDEKLLVQEHGNWKVPVDLSEIELGVPESIKQLIEKQLERLKPDERTVLEGASVAGMECSSVAIAAGLDMPIETVERHCEELARHHFLSPGWLVELPDGTVTPRHRFIHVLYLEVPYSLMPRMRRSQVHHRIAECGVAIYGERVCEIAAELAMHFEQSRDWPRALEYLLLSAENATARSAHHEAADLARRGLEVLKSLPDTSGRRRQELKLRMLLGVSLMATKGFAAPELEEVYAKGKELYGSNEPSPQLFNILYLLGLFYITGGRIGSALEIAQQLLSLAESLEDPTLLMEAHRAMGATLIELGKCTEALHYFERASYLYSANRHHHYSLTIGHDCKVLTECSVARGQWALGFPDTALARMQAGVAIARELSHPQSLVGAAHLASQLHHLRGEPLLARDLAIEVIELAEQHGLALWVALGKIDLGCADAELGNAQQGIKSMRQGFGAYEATGGKLWSPYFLGLLADALYKAGEIEEGLAIIERALTLAEETGEKYSLADLYRIKGDLTIKAGAAIPASHDSSKARGRSAVLNSAKMCFEEALTVAKQQQTRSWELRANISLYRLQCCSQNLTRPQLAEIYSSFTEGLETADLQQARELLNPA